VGNLIRCDLNPKIKERERGYEERESSGLKKQSKQSIVQKIINLKELKIIRLESLEMKLRSITFALLVCLSALALSSANITSTVNLYSQENEYRQVDLSVLGVATGPFSAPAVANT